MKISIALLSILISISAFASDEKFWNAIFFQNIDYSELITEENKSVVKPILLDIDKDHKSREWDDKEKIDAIKSVLATFLSEIAFKNQLTYQTTLAQFQSGKLNKTLSAMYLNDKKLKKKAQVQKEHLRKKILECVITNMRNQPANMRDYVASYCKLEHVNQS
jgi:hypothetical protein